MASSPMMARELSHMVTMELSIYGSDQKRCVMHTVYMGMICVMCSHISSCVYVCACTVTKFHLCCLPQRHACIQSLPWLPKKELLYFLCAAHATTRTLAFGSPRWPLGVILAQCWTFLGTPWGSILFL